MSDFQQCIKWLKEGKKVRRPGFLSDASIFPINGSFYLGSNNEQRLFNFGIFDFEATDWEIYCEKHIFGDNIPSACSNCGVKKIEEKCSYEDCLNKPTINLDIKTTNGDHKLILCGEHSDILSSGHAKFNVVENPPNPHAIITEVKKPEGNETLFSKEIYCSSQGADVFITEDVKEKIQNAQKRLKEELDKINIHGKGTIFEPETLNKFFIGMDKVFLEEFGKELLEWRLK